MRKRKLLALAASTGSVGAALATLALRQDSKLALLSEGYTRR